MSRSELVRGLRAALDRRDPSWREEARRAAGRLPGSVVVLAAMVPGPDGRPIEVALLADPEPVTDVAQFDPFTTPEPGFFR